MTATTKAERAEALEWLRFQLKPGDTVHTVLRHVSKSGMSRDIDLYLLVNDDKGSSYPLRLSYRAAQATGFTYNQRAEAVRVGGAGMDMGFHLVYNLSSALFPDGFDCIGDHCPANDHANAYYYRQEGKEVPSHHRDGGYALRQQWI